MNEILQDETNTAITWSQKNLFLSRIFVLMNQLLMDKFPAKENNNSPDWMLTII